MAAIKISRNIQQRRFRKVLFQEPDGGCPLGGSQYSPFVSATTDAVFFLAIPH